MTGAGQASNLAWRAGWLTALSTPSAIASDGRRLVTVRSRWDFPARSLTRSANSPRRIFKLAALGDSFPASARGGYASQNGFSIPLRASRRVSPISERSRAFSEPLEFIPRLNAPPPLGEQR